MRRQLGSLRGHLSLGRYRNGIVRRGESSDSERPVLLLYGAMAPRRSFESFEARLSEDGYGVWSLNLAGVFDRFKTRGLDECAEQLAEEVERLCARHRLGPLALIGHSSGGLVGRYYVKRLGGEHRVRTLITLGTPHQGTPTAYLGAAALGLVSRSVWQLAPMSAFVRRLELGRMPGGVRMVSIYSKSDRVCPFPSCILETDVQPNRFNVEVPGVRHRDFLTDARVYQVVRRELVMGGDASAAEDAGATVTRLPFLTGR